MLAHEFFSLIEEHPTRLCERVGSPKKPEGARELGFL